jgi:predicted O-methyltransferase YrrM
MEAVPTSSTFASRVRSALRRRLAARLLGDPGERWNAVDAHICSTLLAPDPALDAALAEGEAGGLPPITVSRNQGKLLELLARVHGARAILELGTLGGYSTISLARALPEGGSLVTLEFDPHFAEVARRNIAAAGFADLVEVRVGAALDTLPALAEEGRRFDMFFIDADNRNLPRYVEWAIELGGPGSLIVVDNVVGDGAIIDAQPGDPWREEGGVEGVRRFYEIAGADPRLDITAVQTVGSKGYDGFALALVTDLASGPVGVPGTLPGAAALQPPPPALPAA